MGFESSRKETEADLVFRMPDGYSRARFAVEMKHGPSVRCPQSSYFR
jgi:hypothetical protein